MAPPLQLAWFAFASGDSLRFDGHEAFTTRIIRAHRVATAGNLRNSPYGVRWETVANVSGRHDISVTVARPLIARRPRSVASGPVVDDDLLLHSWSAF